MKHNALIALLALSIVLPSCKQDDPIIQPYNGFPVEVGQIFIDKCATAGCHTDQSYAAEGRMSLSSWQSAFKGSRAGAAIVPYRDDFSYLLYFVNRDSALGPVQTPTMPFNAQPLTAAEVQTIREWIMDGAPDINGNIKFSGLRAKVYVTNQGCDNVAVFDKGTNLIMRYIDVGELAGAQPAEAPHNIKVSPDGQYWYAVFANGAVIEKHRTSDDGLVGRVSIGSGDWNTLTISPDGRYGFAVATNATKLAVADLQNMITVPNGIVSLLPGTLPHGSALSPDLGTLYITQEAGNKVFKVTLDANMTPIDLNQMDLGGTSALGPHEIMFLPDGNLAVTCRTVNQVRIYSPAETLLATLNVADDPLEMAVSPSRKYLFVTCQEEEDMWGNVANKKGAVAVIDYETMQVITHIYPGYQPHGIAVDDASGLVYVANRNRNTTGPAPHHDAICGIRNGYLTLIDMDNLALVPGFNAELSDDPYSVAIKF